MKISFSPKPLAPAAYVRVRITADDRGTKKLVREDGIELIEIGGGKQEEMNARRFILLSRAVVQAAKHFKKRKIAVEMELATPDAASIMAQNFEMANYEFTTLKTKPKEGFTTVEEVLLCGISSKEIIAGATRGQMIGKAVNRARELSNTPAKQMTPRLLAKAAKDAAKGIDSITVKTLGRKEIEALGMGLLAGVGAGSAEEPTFTIMEYKGPGAANQKPIVLAGKGITFDSGGLNIKPSSGIYEMHMDMMGAASVLAAVIGSAQLGLKKHVIGLLPSAENLVGQNATRPGDIHTSLSGKTVEVTDTDAEGRLVLADAITYAKRFKPSVVIDVATLTGAAVVALGFHASGLLTRDDSLADQLLALSESTGDYLWRLPLWDEYETVVKSDFADMVNHPLGGQGRYGGATVGAIFLWQFAKDLGCPWAHIDIAPTMTSQPGSELAKGAAGPSVRLLLSFIESWNAK